MSAHSAESVDDVKMQKASIPQPSDQHQREASQFKRKMKAIQERDRAARTASSTFSPTRKVPLIPRPKSPVCTPQPALDCTDGSVQPVYSGPDARRDTSEGC